MHETLTPSPSPNPNPLAATRSAAPAADTSPAAAPLTLSASPAPCPGAAARPCVRASAARLDTRHGIVRQHHSNYGTFSNGATVEPPAKRRS